MRFEDFEYRSLFWEHYILHQNPLDPRTASLLGYSLVQPEVVLGDGTPRDVRYSICIPSKLVQYWLLKKRIPSPNDNIQINLTIFFSAPGMDLSTSTLGIKYLLRHVTNNVIIVVPNFEDNDKGRQCKKAGITTDIIDTLIKETFLSKGFEVNFEYTITCLTAYSAGYGGLVQTINNELISLTNLKKIVFYDCLYRCDNPELPKGEKPPKLLPIEDNNGPDEIDGAHTLSAFNTRRAIIKAKAINQDLEVIAYCATEKGSPRYLQGNKGYTVAVDKLIDLRSTKGYPNTLYALTLTRVLELARIEGRLTENDIPLALKKLRPIIPKRGQIASVLSQQIESKTGFIPDTNLESWGVQNKKLIDDAIPDFSRAIKIVADRALFYPGYPAKNNKAGLLHIAQIFEFAWEEFVS